MKRITIETNMLTDGAAIISSDGDFCDLCLSSRGAGFVIPPLTDRTEHYLVFKAEVMEDHSMPFNLLVYERGEKPPVFTVRFGLLPRVEATVAIDLDWMNAGELFPEAMPGTLKIVCHGRRVRREMIDRIVLASLPAFHDIKLRLSGLSLCSERPSEAELPDVKLVDEFGQSKWKSWRGKTEDIACLREKLKAQIAEASGGYPFSDPTEYGGWKAKKLTDGTGYFSKCKKDGR